MARQFCFEGVRFDSDSGELQVGEVTHRLASQPSQFLIALLERPGQVVTREELRRRLWPDDTFIDFDTGLNSVVRKVRDALNDSAGSPRFIETLPRRGYRFIAPLQNEQTAPRATPPQLSRTHAPSLFLVAIVIVATIVSTPGSDTTANTRYVDVQAHGSLLKGLVALSSGGLDGFRAAVAHFEDAIARQSNFAPAHAGLAFATLQFAFVGPLAPDAFMRRAEAAARKAVELDPTLAEAHGALGLVLKNQWDWEGATREFRRAIDLNPSYAEAYRMYALMLSLRGRHAEALAMLTRVHELGPVSLQTTLDYASALLAAGDHEKGLAEFRKALQRFPQSVRIHFHAGSAYLRHGVLDEGLAELREAVRLAPENVRFVTQLAYAEAVAGHHDEARRLLAAILVRARSEYVSPTSIALIHSALDSRESALEWIEIAYRTRALDIHRLFSEPEFQRLHGDPRVRDILTRAALPQ